jgi:hypothetical protein
MKITRFLSIVALVTSSTLFSFGQERVALAISSDNFLSANSNGFYTFVVPTDISAKDVALSAEYYTMYFSVQFNEKNHQALITMKDKTDNARHIICRFFISLGLREIEYNGTTFSVEDFYQKYLQTEKK